MSAGITHRLYLVGEDPTDTVRNSDVFVDEKSAQEDAVDSENIYYIDATLFASRLKLVERWGEE